MYRSGFVAVPTAILLWAGAAGCHDLFNLDEHPQTFVDPASYFKTGDQAISAVNGICQGGGLMIAMLSDMAVVSDRATFRAPELFRGIADTHYGHILARQVGPGRARDLLYTAPCDLRAATRAVFAYQQALAALPRAGRARGDADDD